MIRFAAAFAVVLASAAPLGGGALAAGGPTEKPPAQSWTFDGPLGRFDRAQLQRGFKVYREVCAACHSMSLLRFRNLYEPGGPQFTQPQVTALAATYQIQDGPNDRGEMFERPGRPADPLPRAHPNEQAARAANGGAYPPDLSLIAKARTYERGFPLFLLDIFTQYNETGPNYLAALLGLGYVKPPEGFQLSPGQHYNKYMPGGVIAMADPLARFFDESGKVTEPDYYTDGTPVTRLQMAKDVTAFLQWVAEPTLEERKKIGLRVMIFLAVFATLLYFTKKKIWARLGGEDENQAPYFEPQKTGRS